MRRILALSALISCASPPPDTTTVSESPLRPEAPLPFEPASADDAEVLIIGGGYEPQSSAFSLQQDVQLAQQTFAGPIHTLFGSGEGTLLAKASATEVPSTRQLLGRFFGTRSEATLVYEPATLHLDGPNTKATSLKALERAMSQKGPQLTVYAATHGDHGDQRIDNALILWGQQYLSGRDLAPLIESANRPTVFISTSCFGGGLADAVLLGLPKTCGFFAARFDEAASGCDPNPDRGAQEAYGLYFLNALRGADREGEPLPFEQLDIDKDGGISYLEAHTYVSYTSQSLDVPNTTSDRWLELTIPAPNTDFLTLDPSFEAEANALWAAERAIIVSLSEALSLKDYDAVLAKRGKIEDRLDRLDDKIRSRELAVESAWHDLRIYLVTQWPALSSPWSPQFESTLQTYDDPIREALLTSDLGKTYQSRVADLHGIYVKQERTRLRLSRVERLQLAYLTLLRGAQLRQTNPEGWEQYLTLRDCENRVPRTNPLDESSPGDYPSPKAP